MKKLIVYIFIAFSSNLIFSMAFATMSSTAFLIPLCISALMMQQVQSGGKRRILLFFIIFYS